MLIPYSACLQKGPQPFLSCSGNCSMFEPTVTAVGNKILTGGELPLSFKMVHFFLFVSVGPISALNSSLDR